MKKMYGFKVKGTNELAKLFIMHVSNDDDLPEYEVILIRSSGCWCVPFLNSDRAFLEEILEQNSNPLFGTQIEYPSLGNFSPNDLEIVEVTVDY